jgi:hypothetical protein
MVIFLAKLFATSKTFLRCPLNAYDRLCQTRNQPGLVKQRFWNWLLPRFLPVWMPDAVFAMQLETTRRKSATFQ